MDSMDVTLDDDFVPPFVRAEGPQSAERTLALRLFDDAITTLSHGVRGGVSARAVDVLAWIDDGDGVAARRVGAPYPLTFAQVCGHLRCDVDGLRDRIRRRITTWRGLTRQVKAWRVLPDARQAGGLRCAGVA